MADIDIDPEHLREVIAQRRQSLGVRWSMMVSGSNADLRHTLHGHAIQALFSAPSSSSSSSPTWPEVDAAALEVLVEALERTQRRGQQQCNALAARGQLGAHFSLSDYTLRSRRAPSSSSSSASLSAFSVSPDMQTHLALLWRTLSILRFAGLPRALQTFFSQLLTAVLRMPPLSLSTHFSASVSVSSSASSAVSVVSGDATTALVGTNSAGLLPVPELQYLSASFLASGGQQEAPLGHDPSLIGTTQLELCFFIRSRVCNCTLHLITHLPFTTKF